MQNRPNILLLLTDDQRHDTIGALGHPDLHTPHLDSLVADGVTCTHAHVMGGNVGAICMPSRAMLHTGRHLFGLQSNGGQIPQEHALLGELLREAGYRTWGTGKWHNGTASYARSFSEGAEIFFGGMADHWNVPACHFDPSGRYAHFAPECVDYWQGVRSRVNRCDHVSPGRHSTDLFADACCDFLATTRDQTTPFFASVAFMAPHDPRVMPKPYLESIDPDQLTLPPNLLGEHPFDNGDLQVRDEHLAPYPRDEAVVRSHLRDYYAMIHHLDTAIGRIFAALEEAGQKENTMIVLAGDNGLAVGQHGLMGKQSLYDHSSRVPLLIAGPGLPSDIRRSGLCYLHDVMPTLLELAGLPIPPAVQSRSLLPMLMEGSVIREKLHTAYRGCMRGVRDAETKLIRYVVDGKRREQLFHLPSDPWELHNLIDDPAWQDRRRSLAAALKEWQTQLDDSLPENAAFWEH